MTIGEFAGQAQIFCGILKGSVTSWGRTLAHNATLPGSVAHSAHVAWRAIDVVYDVPVPETERRAWASRLGLKLVIEKDHDHLEPADWLAG